jgi:NAD-dependent oxidoreductase involved in siderophore biosynthesis
MGPHCTRLEQHPVGAPEDQKQLHALARRAGVNYTTATRWLAHLPVMKQHAEQLEAALAPMRAEKTRPCTRSR